ncbi:B3 domain-containing protein REM17-like [Bidens hawaiensis]|uniref:B3 domain-containing protein REM17-like n=1 Tax=Bidens hawaiensis TaxID=980011 RepID=UPI00404A9F98
MISRFSETYKEGPHKKWDIDPESSNLESSRLAEMAWENLEKDEENDKALKKIPKEKDTAMLDHNNHPYFIDSLKSDCRYNLYLPINFTRSSGLRTRKMILRNGQSQMSWAVELNISSKGYSHIVRGWLEFSTANGLKEGDHFKLELIQTGIKPIAVFYSNISLAYINGHLTFESIPVSYRKYIKGRRNNKTVVLKRGCQKWRVKMIDWAFTEGWDNFVRVNGVQEFDVVVFKHQGNMLFDTMYIPKNYALANGLSNGEMILKYAENEGSWKVKFANHSGIFYYIQVGLKEFCVANGLKKGDRP